MSHELSLASTQCQLNVVIILISDLGCISVRIVVFFRLNQVCCLFMILFSFVDIVVWIKWDMIKFILLVLVRSGRQLYSFVLILATFQKNSVCA